jgi:cytochrome c553
MKHLTAHSLTVRLSPFLTSVALLLCVGSAHAADTSAEAQLQRWSAQAGAPGDATRGKVFFTSRHGAEWSCASCHGTPPTAQGEHASTGKSIAPLAPAFNAKAFTDSAKVDKWFRRNCQDVLNRECRAAEKADVLAYLLGFKP